MTRTQQDAATFKSLCAHSDTLSGFVDNVRVTDDATIEYDFDGFICCTMFLIDGNWVDIGDHTPEMGIPDSLTDFKQGSIEVIFALLEEEIANPPDSFKC